jgi:pilus assembly protein Flp/PilA
MKPSTSPLIRRRRGQGLVEYALIICSVALISAAAISLFGHKTSDLIDAITSILPGAHTGDNGPIVSGHLLETTDATTGAPISLDINAILAVNGTARLQNNVFGSNGNEGASSQGFGGLILESR